MGLTTYVYRKVGAKFVDVSKEVTNGEVNHSGGYKLLEAIRELGAMDDIGEYHPTDGVYYVRPIQCEPTAQSAALAVTLPEPFGQLLQDLVRDSSLWVLPIN